MKNNVPVDTVALDKMMGALAHRGPDGCHRMVCAPLGLGHQHFWTTPEEIGERQPLTQDGLTIAFDGRLDNREELLAALNLDMIDERQLSDAAIVVRAYERWGDDCFKRLLGPFSIVIYEHRRQQLICARDPLGDRSLFYYVNSEIVVVASEEQALLTHPRVSDILDEDMVAYYFDLLNPCDGRTMFVDIKEIQQGTTITFTQESVHKGHYWDFTPPANIRYAADAEYAEHFLALLKESVRCRMRSTTPIAVLMSGGLDSTSIAAVATDIDSYPLTTVSWVYDELKELDERVYIDTCNEHLQTNPVFITGDDAWPLSDFDSWLVKLNHPWSDPYERLNERAYRAVSERGIRPLLTGMFGDHMYSGAYRWLADLLQEGRVRDTINKWRFHSHGEDVYFAMTDPGLRYLVQVVLNRIPGGQWIRPKRPLQRSWLTPAANKRLNGKDCCAPTLPPAVRRPRQFQSLYSGNNAREVISSTANAAKFGVELRYPYHDRRLLEFVLAIPAHQLYNGVFVRHFAREAVKHLLPDQVRLRTKKSVFSSLLMRGIAERELLQVYNILNKPDAVWPNFVASALIPLKSLTDFQEQLYHLYKNDMKGLSIIWNCIIFELWWDMVQHR